jgi:hypothetical protein
MTRTLRNALLALLSSTALLAALTARAGVVATDRAASAASERERVKALVERPDVTRKLESLGVPPKDAVARVDALTDREVASLAARIDALPAGAMSTQEWLLVIIAVLLLVIAL